MALIVFTEERTPAGIRLHATMAFTANAIIPNYKGGSIDKRKMAEGYLVDAITQNYVRVRGLPKLYATLEKLSAIPPTDPIVAQSLSDTKKVIIDLIEELKNPQYQFKGNAK